MDSKALLLARAARGLCAASLLLAGCGDSDAGTQASGTTATQTTGTPGGTSEGPPTTGQVTGPGPGNTSTGGGASASTSTGAVATTTTGAVDETTAGPTTQPPITTGPDQTTGNTTAGEETTGGEAQIVRFVVLGDTGEGNEDQYSVAQAIVEICAQKGCDFGVLTGDNFYDSGVSGVDDPQWQEKFELPYEDITFPIYPVLGNHDYGGDGIGVDFDGSKDDYQVEYSQVSQLWKMPAKFHNLKIKHAEFWWLDTNQVMTDPFNGDSDDQKDWLIATTAASTATWKIAFGHHPYISNGDHGNAGNYENIEAIPLPFVSGENVKEFMEDAVCGKIHAYLCGHDHNLQWLEPKCGTEFIVSGAGSKAEDLPGDNPKFFQHNMEGFIWVELKDDSFTGVFYDKSAAELYSRTFNK